MEELNQIENSLMGLTETLKEKLSALNPVKENASATSWRSFYLKKSFTSDDAHALQNWMNLDWDSALEITWEFESSEESDTDVELKFMEVWKSLRHAFRIVMSLAQSDVQKITCFEEILTRWPFEHFSQFSDDVSSICLLEFPKLNNSILKIFGARYFGEHDAIILLNSLIFAMDQLLRAYPEHHESARLFKAMVEALKDPALYHTENILVLATTLCGNPRLDRDGALAIKRVFESRYVPNYVKLDDLRPLNPDLISEMKQLQVERHWVADIPFSVIRFIKAISWLGFQGRFEQHQMHMLGCILNPFKEGGVLQYLQEQVERAESMDIPLVMVSPGQQFSIERLSLELAQHSLEIGKSANSEIFISDSEDLEPYSRLTIIGFSICEFLQAFDEWESGILEDRLTHQVIKKFLSQLSLMNDEVDQIPDESFEQISDFIQRLKTIWTSGIKTFIDACLAERRDRGLRDRPTQEEFTAFWHQFEVDEFDSEESIS